MDSSVEVASTKLAQHGSEDAIRGPKGGGENSPDSTRRPSPRPGLTESENQIEHVRFVVVVVADVSNHRIISRTGLSHFVWENLTFSRMI